MVGLLNKVLRSQPKRATHRPLRRVAGETGVAKSTVHRFLRRFGLQPHRSKSFKLSNDPFFVDTVRDIAGLYLHPPDKALVLCVDENSQIQALERTQTILPLGLGYVEGVTHDYLRHGTTTLFAALDVPSGIVISHCKPRHRHQEFLAFLRHLDAPVPPALALHLVVDNYATHKHPKVRAWLAAHPRYHMHYAPTYSSWLKQVERWFGLITQRSIRRGSFRNVTELVQRIARYVTHHNRHAGPFQWTAIADSILGKIARLSKNYLRDVTVGASARPAAKLTSRKESVRKACPKAVPERVALIARKQIAMGCTKDMVRAALGSPRYDINS